MPAYIAAGASGMVNTTHASACDDVIDTSASFVERPSRKRENEHEEEGLDNAMVWAGELSIEQ